MDIVKIYHYVYETKCRRCGKLKDWYFRNPSLVSCNKFRISMADYVNDSCINYYDKCNKNTVQDLVSYGKLDAE